MRDLPATPVLVGLVLSGVALGLLGSWGWRSWRTRRARRRLVNAITSTGFEHLQDVLVPDGNGSTYHIDFLVLTPRGILVVDLRDVSGNIFGGDQMTDWTVMNGAMRHTFPNPQGPLYDRVAAVKALSGQVPVEGRVVFTRRARFPKGLPKWTMPVDTLRAEFPPADRGMFQEVLVQFREGWEAVRSGSAPSTLVKPRPI
ncbi:MAG TPA: nuclease-related domain-containing protein [Steroidobacteraceae bacterium]|nr:nuclease-related domain-containing protein [Steroidobacteraceae bacterium]HNS28203.1 nuclease-related domain-containing protein [Steroidobacteraceae bacterium]